MLAQTAYIRGPTAILVNIGVVWRISEREPTAGGGALSLRMPASKCTEEINATTSTMEGPGRLLEGNLLLSC